MAILHACVARDNTAVTILLISSVGELTCVGFTGNRNNVITHNDKQRRLPRSHRMHRVSLQRGARSCRLTTGPVASVILLGTNDGYGRIGMHAS